MRRIVVWVTLAGVAAVAAAAVYLAWDLDWRWRPRTLSHRTDEIARALNEAGWVSPGLTGPAVYIVVHRDCAPCEALQADLTPKLQAAEVDTRFVAVAPPDRAGQTRSTPAERATVAELWTNRSWKLFQEWTLAPAAAWTAPGVPPADGDAARTAVVEASRRFAASLKTDLAANGVAFAYPMLIWQVSDGRWRACACVSPRSYAFVAKDLGA
ncbi:MAG: hypothetical protein ACREEW_07310 [Caulobacteraceae bacterium]